MQALDLHPHLGDEVGRGEGLRQIIVLKKKDHGIFNHTPDSSRTGHCGVGCLHLLELECGLAELTQSKQ